MISPAQREVLERQNAPTLANTAWRKPLPGSVKINCDVAVPRQGSMATAAMVVRDEFVKLIDGSFFKFKMNSVLQGELEAIRKACYWASAKNANSVVRESDSRLAISLSVSALVPPWEVFPLVMDIRKLRQQWNIKLEWVRRSANSVAHQVAAMALAVKGRLAPNWVANPPFLKFHLDRHIAILKHPTFVIYSIHLIISFDLHDKKHLWCVPSMLGRHWH